MTTKNFQVNKDISGINQPVVTINQKQTATNSRDLGFLLNRGQNNQNVALIWNEINNLFRLAFTTDIASDDNAQLTISSNAPIATGTQYVSTGNFAVEGDARAGVYVARCQTQGTDWTELSLDGAGTKLVVSPNSVWTYEILLSAKCVNIPSVLDAASFKITGAVGRNDITSSVSIIGNPSFTIIGRTDPNWEADLTVDPATGALVIKVKGSLGKTIRWVAKVVTTEVVYS